MLNVTPEFAEIWRREAMRPAPTDQDNWSLVFDPDTRRLCVRHEWQTSRHDGFDELELAEFLKGTGSAQTALIDGLFLVMADA